MNVEKKKMMPVEMRRSQQDDRKLGQQGGGEMEFLQALRSTLAFSCRAIRVVTVVSHVLGTFSH